MALKTLAFSIVGFVAAMLAVVGFYWAQLPPSMAVHFSLEGIPNGWMSKSLYVAVVTVVTLVILVSYLAVFAYSSINQTVRDKLEDCPRRPRYRAAFALAFVSLEIELLVLHILIIFQNMHESVRVASAEWGLLIAAMVATQFYAAYVLVKRNRTSERK